MDSSQQAQRTILVFGPPGQGKTSMLHAITDGQHSAKVSNNAEGPKHRFCSSTSIVKHENIYYQFVECAGLINPGGVFDIADLQHFIKLAKSTRHGISLMIFVTHFRITKETFPNYELFVKTLAQDRIPVLVVVTHCEAQSPPSAWATTKNKDTFAKAGITGVEGIIGTSFARSANKTLDEAFAAAREKSADDVWAAIEAHSSVNPIDFMG